VRVGLKINQHELTWPALVSRAGRADELGFDNLWIFDHFRPQTAPLTGPCMEAWSLLAALAVTTTRIRLGALATGVMWRNPAVLAAQAATIDNLAEGRLEIAIGAAWDDTQHRALGVAFPAIRERSERLDEAIQVMRTLFTEDHATFTGRYYRLRDASYRPRPLQSHIPIWVAAGGDRLMIPLAARRADVWHCFEGIEVLPEKVRLFDHHAAEAGRDPSSIRRAANIDMSGGDRDVLSDAARLRELRFTDLVVPWPPEAIERVERFAERVLPRIQEIE
jgi:alkanesulfonate monooxygenase SsuD/methylene tetrahydromethanopterin reductase-like flavin-dependent oxidoreductase (luciferase family)